MKTVFALFFLIFLLQPCDLYAQPDADRKTDKTLISVPVTVSDREGRYIAGLKKGDFTLYQDGVKQDIAFFETYEEPLNIALLIDTSGSTEDSLGKIKNAAKDFVGLLNPSDRCLIATFDAKIKILNPLSSNQQTLKNALNNVQTAQSDGTLMYDALEQIAEKSFDNAPGRKVIVILTDGKDIGSTATKAKLMGLLEESDILIYSVYYKTGEGFNKVVLSSGGVVKEGDAGKKPKKQKAPKKPKGYSIFIPAPTNIPTDAEIEQRERLADVEGLEALRAMSDTTAGRFYLSDTPGLSDVFKKVAGELREQYRIGYRSTDAATSSAIHDIVVKVDRPDVVVRARPKLRGRQL